MPQSLLTPEDGCQATAFDASWFSSVLNHLTQGCVVMLPADGASDGAVDFRPVWSNAAARELAGLSDDRPGATAGFSAFYNLTPEQRRSVQAGSSFSYEYEHPDGRWIRVNHVPFQNGYLALFEDISEQKRLAQEGENQQARLNDILTQAPNGLIAYEAIRDESGQLTDFKTVHYNLNVLRCTGYTPEQMQVSLFERSPIARYYTERFGTLIETGEPFSMEAYDEDRQKWFRSSFGRFGDGMIVSYEDITIYKQQQLALAERNWLLKYIFDHMQFGLAVLKVVRDETGAACDWKYERVNRYWLREAGLTPSQVTGKTVGEVYPEKLGSDELAQYARTLETGTPQRFEVHYAKDGQPNWADVSAVRLEKDRLIVSYLVVTENKQTRLELTEQVRQKEQQAQLLRTVVDRMPAGMALFRTIRDEAGRALDFVYELANPRLTAYAGLTEADFLNRRMTDIFPDSRHNPFFQAICRAADTGEPVQEVSPYQADGLDIWIDYQLIPFDNQVLYLFTDVTESYRNQQHLQVANRELRRSNEALQQFAYIASHDLQEPLRKVQTFGDVLKDQFGQSLGQTGNDLIDRMQSSSRRMNLLIQDLLQYSRMNRLPEALRPVDLRQVVQQVLQDLEVTSQQMRAEIEVGPLPVVPGDFRQLAQLLLNLISNALKFHQPGTPPRVQIRSVLQSAGELPVSEKIRPGTVYHLITVADEGIGFNAQYTERIFQMFQRLHGRDQYEGTGIGLAICQKVAENHGGFITARSEPGAGSTFMVYLPAQQTFSEV